MLGLIFASSAAILSSISNYCMRRSIDAGGSSKAYLVVQLTFSFFVMILLNPVRTQDYGWNTTSVILGLLGGVLLGVLMWGLGKTLENGPSGLSFAVMNTSSVMPAILLAFLFGASHGHGYTLSHGLGSVLVVAGLFWAGKTSGLNSNKIWIFFAIFIFVLHTTLLTYWQWWALVLKPDLPTTTFLPFHIEPKHVQWYSPAFFLTAALFQWIVYWWCRQSKPSKKEIVFGIVGGGVNGIATFFLILAPQYAKPWENAMIFPIFSVSVIVICNVWSQILYKERINWWANSVCVLGIVVGTLAWPLK